MRPQRRWKTCLDNQIILQEHVLKTVIERDEDCDARYDSIPDVEVARKSNLAKHNLETSVCDGLEAQEKIEIEWLREKWHRSTTGGLLERKCDWKQEAKEVKSIADVDGSSPTWLRRTFMIIEAIAFRLEKENIRQRKLRPYFQKKWWAASEQEAGSRQKPFISHFLFPVSTWSLITIRWYLFSKRSKVSGVPYRIFHTWLFENWKNHAKITYNKNRGNYWSWEWVLRTTSIWRALIVTLESVRRNSVVCAIFYKCFYRRLWGFILIVDVTTLHSDLY